MTLAAETRRLTIADAEHPFHWWARQLGIVPGGPIPLTTDEESVPRPGYYRGKSKDGTARAYLYWFQPDGALVCKRNGQDLDDLKAREAFKFVCRKPVTKEAYETFLKGLQENGVGTWPDESAAVTASLSNNAPDDDSLEGLKAQIDALAAEVNRLVEKGAAKNQQEADQAADLAARLSALRNRADAARAKEKKPHWDMAVATDDRWRPVIAAAGVYTEIKNKVVGPFLVAEQERIAAEDRARAEATARAVLEGKEPPPPPAQQTAAPRAGGSRGRVTSLRNTRVAVIKDFEKAAAAVLKAYPDAFKAFVEEKVTLAAKGGIALDGCEIAEIGKAV